MAKIYTIRARQIYDSNGWPTVEVTVWLDNGAFGVSSVPAASTESELEPVEIRDNDQSFHFGNGVNQVVNLINTYVAPRLKGLDPSQQNQIDQTLLEIDGTKNKSKLGVNGILPVSQAVVKAGASLFQMPVYEYLARKYQLVKGSYALPVPITSIINGGKHGLGNLDFLEFHVIPSTRHAFDKQLQISSEMYHAVEKSLISNNAIHSVGGQGGFTPNLFTNIDALEVISEAVKLTPYFSGQDLFLGIDVGADNLLSKGKYSIKDRSKVISRQELLQYYEELNKKYHLFVLEDPFSVDDVSGWQDVTKDIGQDTLIVADRLTIGNQAKIQAAITKSACTAVIVKPNQIGTITETIKIISLIKSAGLSVVIAHRLGETNDTFIADLAVGVGAGYVKFGAMARGERVVKYNRLLQIYEMLQPQA